MSANSYLAVSGTVFVAIGVVHLFHIILAWPFSIGSFDVPMWMSWVAVFAAGTLSTWAFHLTNPVGSDRVEVAGN